MSKTLVVDNFLAHYGRKGMKWGIRRSPQQLASGSPATKPSWATDPPDRGSGSSGDSSGKKSKGSKPDASPDAVVFNALRQKAKEGGIQSLSNDEIRVLTTRASAMDQYAKTFPKQKTRKQKVAAFVVGEVLVGTGKTLMKDVTKHMAQEGLRKKGLLPTKGDKKPDADTSGGTS